MIDGLTDYYLTSFESAADFISSLDQPKLKITSEDFWKLLEMRQYADFLAQNRVSEESWKVFEQSGKRKTIEGLLFENNIGKWESIGKTNLGEGKDEILENYKQLSELVGILMGKRNENDKKVQEK